MKDLGPDARALLEVGREGEEPSAVDHARNRRALVQKLGAGAMIASVGVGTASSAAAATVTLTSVVVPFLVGGVVGAAAVGAAWVREGARTQDPPAFVVPAVSAARAPLVVTSAQLESRPARSTMGGQEPASAPARDERTEIVPRAPRAVALQGNAVAPVDPAPLASTATPSVGEEIELLRAAQERLHTGAPALALAILDEHARRFPHGALSQERRASRVLALCQLGQLDAGRAEGDRFIAEWPSSPFVERIRRACAR